MTATTKDITLTPMQDGAVEAIKEWYTNSSKQTFFLAGFAGTGKSTIVQHAIDVLGVKKEKVEFACYTGKAALVLSQKASGKFKVKTIHRLIYKLDEATKGAPTFILRAKHELDHLKLIVIDECSMVDGQVMQDLKSFGVKILFIGDTGQLPPVNQKGNEDFLKMFNNPDYTLTEIHRQAEGNPIIYLSMLARTKQPIPYGWYGANREVLVIDQMQWHQVKQHCYTTADQIICGKNKTRHGLNQDIRQYLGYTNILPQKGDKLICTRNDWGKSIQDINLVNGMTGYVDYIKYDMQDNYDIKREAMKIAFRPDFTDKKFHNLYLVNDHFTDKEYKLLPHEYSIYSEFDYGYCITCHKSQGSQWNNVVVISEMLNREEHHRWLYTAITRSAEKLVLVI